MGQYSNRNKGASELPLRSRRFRTSVVIRQVVRLYPRARTGRIRARPRPRLQAGIRPSGPGRLVRNRVDWRAVDLGRQHAPTSQELPRSRPAGPGGIEDVWKRHDDRRHVEDAIGEDGICQCQGRDLQSRLLSPAPVPCRTNSNVYSSLKALGPKTPNSKTSAATTKSTCSRPSSPTATLCSRACWAGAGRRSSHWRLGSGVNCATCRFIFIPMCMWCMGRSRRRNVTFCPICFFVGVIQACSV